MASDYATIETKAVAVLKKHADFADVAGVARVIRGSNKQLAKGLPRVARLDYGGERREPLTLKYDSRIWITFVDLFVPWRGDMAELNTRLQTEMAKVIQTFDQYPALDATAGLLRSHIVQGQTSDLLTEARGAYRGKRMFLESVEVVNPGRAE